MKKRILSLFLTLIMAMTLMPVSALADELEVTVAEIYVSSSGDDVSGNGTKDSPYATLAKAVDIAPDGATIYVMTNLSMTQCARFYDKHLTITSSGEYAVTITRGDSFETQSDDARSWYNPAMIEVQTTSSSAGLTLTNIILDDDGKHMGTVFAQASSGEENTANTKCVQDAIIASNATVLCTITLGEGAILRNFGGMSAVRVTDQAKLVMKSGSVIEDTIEDFNRTKGTATDEVGPAGAVWLQGAIFEMEDGAVISNINGRAVYVDGGEAAIGGKISNITGNNKMWQGTSGTALHLRNNATGTLTATGLIANVTGGGSIVNLSGSTYTMDAGSVMSGNQGNNIAAYGGANTIYMNGEITGIRSGNGNGNYDAINLQAVSDAKDLIYCKIGATGNIHDNDVWYGSVYVQGNNIELHHYGKINNNCSSDKSGGIVLANNMTGAKVFMYDGAEVIGNKSDNDGAGVMVSCGTFTMNGGKISGNIAKGQAGGVYVRRGGQFIMNGGEISNNHAKKYGGGVSFVASDYSGYVPYVALNGGTISGNTMGDSDPKVSNDLGIASSDYSHINRYLFLSDDVTIGDRAVYFEKDTKTVTLASDSLDIKLGNAGTEAVNALKTASATKGWGSPLATFWAQRNGAVELTVGGLSPADALPVYVLTLPVDETGSVPDGAKAQVYAAQKTPEGDISLKLPDVSGNGFAVAIVQPTQDFGTLTISGPETIKQNKANADYSVTYTVTYTMSENLKSIIAQTGGNATYDLAVNADTRLSGTPDSFDGKSIQVTYTLHNSEFNAGDSLFTSAELTVTVGQNSYIIPSNVTETKLLGLESVHVVFDWNDGSGKTETISIVEGEALGDKMPANPTRSGYTFTGWNTQADGRGTAFTSATVVNSDLTVYAQWQKNSSDSDNSGSSGTPSGLNTKDHYSYIIGYQDGTLQPYGTITRGEVATIFFRLLTEETREANWSTTNNYADCSPDLWCNNAISTLTRMGIIEGFEDGTFRPNARITRAQFAKIAVGFFETTKEDYAGFFTDVNIGAWYTEYVEAAAHVGLIEGFGDGTFRPDTNITRAQACVIVNRALGRKPDEEHLLNDDEMLTWPDNNPDDWFYADMQEATNSHDYSWITVNDKDGGRVKIENWTEKLPQRDWIAFEHAWSTAYSAPGGEVTQ